MLIDGFRVMRTGDPLYVAVSVITTLTTSLESFSRYVLVIFPFFVWLARVGSTPIADRIIVMASLMMLAVYMTFFSIGGWVT